MAERDQGLIAQAIQEWELAAHGQKDAVVEEWTRTLSISRNTFYRELDRWGRGSKRKPSATKGVRKIPDIEAIVKTVKQIQHRPPQGARRGSTEGALHYAVANGHVPAAALNIPVGTINRVAREQQWAATPRREHRWQADFANQVHQHDASHSEHFIPLRRVGDEWILGMRERRQKNKERHGEGRRKLIAYGLTDDFSGYRLAQYTVAPGESALGSIAFLQWAWSHAAEHAPFEGWPTILYADNGPLTRHKAFREFAARLGLDVQTHEPGRAQCTGKVESNWRTLWRRFETEFFFNPAWRTFEISLTELNQEHAAFWRRWNRREHRALPVSREEAWHRSILERGGVIRVEPGAWDTIFVEAERDLDAAGVFDFRGAPYQVKEIHACKIKVFCRLTDGVLIAEDKRDGRRYPAAPFEMPSFGTYRGAPRTALDDLKEADEGLAAQIPAPPTWRADSNVVPLPVRAGEVRESGFVIPPGPPLEKGGGRSLEELAGGITLIPEPEGKERSGEAGTGGSGEEPIYASDLEWFAAMLVRQARGEVLSPEIAGRMAAMLENSIGVRLLAGDLEKRARLAAVE